MEFHNRRLLLLNEDVPISPFPNLQHTEPMTPSSPPPPMYGSSLQLPPRPIFTSNLAYAFLILFTTVFFLGFILLYIRQFSDNSSTSRRRRRRLSSADAAADDTKPLPTIPYRGDSMPQQVECPICLGEFHEGETVKMIPRCKHVFHPECIDTWLADHVTCPVCRCTKACEVGKVECGGVENREGEGSEAELESEGSLSESTGRGSGGGGGSRFVLGRLLEGLESYSQEC